MTDYDIKNDFSDLPPLPSAWSEPLAIAGKSISSEPSLPIVWPPSVLESENPGTGSTSSSSSSGSDQWWKGDSESDDAFFSDDSDEDESDENASQVAVNERLSETVTAVHGKNDNIFISDCLPSTTTSCFKTPVGSEATISEAAISPAPDSESELGNGLLSLEEGGDMQYVSEMDLGECHDSDHSGGDSSTSDGFFDTDGDVDTDEDFDNDEDCTTDEERERGEEEADHDEEVATGRHAHNPTKAKKAKNAEKTENEILSTKKAKSYTRTLDQYILGLDTLFASKSFLWWSIITLLILMGIIVGSVGCACY